MLLSKPYRGFRLEPVINWWLNSVTEKSISRIKHNRFERRLSLGLAGARSGAALLKSTAGTALLDGEQRQAKRKLALEREAQRFCKDLGKLKGSYVKIGQTMAFLGHSFLPEPLIASLRDLENNTTPLHWKSLEPLLATSLGEDFYDLEVESTPLAAASIGQVHRAVDRMTQQSMVLKVQYPGIKQTIKSDFGDVIQLLRLARWLPSGRSAEAWLLEIKHLLEDEVDYTLERRNIDQFADLLALDTRFVVPGVIDKYCRTDTLAMDYIDGYHVCSPAVQKLNQSVRNDIGIAMLDLLLMEIFDWGVVQTDPNFGNYRIVIDEDGSARLALLDFGAVRALPSPFLDGLRTAIAAAHDENREAIANALVALDCLQADSSLAARQLFVDFCLCIFEPVRQNAQNVPRYCFNDRGEYCWAQSNLLKRAAKLGIASSKDENFTLPAKEFAFIVRKLSGVFNFIAALRAEFNGYDILSHRIRSWREQGIP